MMTSEEENGIRPQPEDTCPKLDYLIEFLSNQPEVSTETLHEAKALIEDIRDHVIGIRAWGQEWKDLAQETKINLEFKTEEADNLLDIIEDKVEEIRKLEKERDELELEIERLNES